MEIVLSIEQLSKRYGAKYAIDAVSFQIPKGSTFGILGPNGSGKTTTLGIALQILNPTSGAVQWFNQPANAESLKKVGAILETPNFYPYLSGENNLKIVADIKGVPYTKINDVLSIVNLFERRKSAFKTYSLGMKQRLAIASALLADPEVLVLDEPTNGLDPQGIAEIRQIIQQVAQSGKTIVLASHLLDEVEKVCTDLAVLKNGKLLFTGKVNELNLKNQQNIIEVKAKDMNALKNALEIFPDKISWHLEKDTFWVTIPENLDSTALNNFLVANGIIVSHLLTKHKGLEAQFLELIAQK